ncbi:binding-protein-dependent transport systems inner membrane component [Rhodomicrobium vannielii ATCC 17100]|uniref:Binding-protein-dependent transport systems inner membrane component n=1 Tax=Rhodomicrobium vannielii (strain ATCC 17100 / DSM 162 / LMG 4299 / NCIMB 10020 / ATH 3.1.1) TaxID=648757 RepID=E3I4Q8_RHOVT|nr:ABC transporter permease [Rhodomicrobium vannielii]ADP72730.1 binding-protein-dependent transport systems inner membrane component [Rhodomicrobium vannielii ATCC 17100]
MTIRAPSLKPFAVLGGTLAVWEAATLLELADPNFLPSPHAVLARGWTEVTTGTLPADLAATLSRHIQGLGIGVSAALAFGLLLGLSKLANRLIGPLFLGFRQIALFAWVPLLSLWFGGNEAGKIAFIAVAAFTPMVVSTWRGTSEISPAHHELAAVLTLGRLDYVRLIALPSALPQVLTGFRSSLIASWLATVGAELFLNVAPGLGGRLNEGRETFQMDLLLAMLIVLVAIGMIYQRLADAGEMKLLKRRTA